MAINRLLISRQHHRYRGINKYGVAISCYIRHSKYIYRPPSNSLKFNRQPSNIAIILTVTVKGIVFNLLN